MKDADGNPEADRAEGAPHPRNAPALVGQAAAERAFLSAIAAGRLHHAWLITGPAGIGKATLGWRIARFLLEGTDRDTGLFGAAPTTLATDPGTARAHRIAALSDPGLFLLRRSWDDKAKRLRAQITAEEARGLNHFFALSQVDGGRRVVIVDAADDMTPQAANALLKLLEEPPADGVFLLISHAPSRLLPTIRSRCRVLPCAPLHDDDMAAALARLLPDEPAHETLIAMARGSVGDAIRFHVHDGPALRDRLAELFAGMPGMNRLRALQLAESLAARDAEPRREVFLRLVEDALADLARAGATGIPPAKGSAAAGARAPDADGGRRWADAQQREPARLRRGLALNLDPQALILDMLLRIDRLADSPATSVHR